MKVHWKKHGQPILAYVYLIYCRNTRAWKIHGAFPGRNGKVSTQLKFSWVLGTQHVSGVSSPGHETPKRVTWRGEKNGRSKGEASRIPVQRCGKRIRWSGHPVDVHWNLLCKNHSSLKWKICELLTKTCSYLFMMVHHDFNIRPMMPRGSWGTQHVANLLWSFAAGSLGQQISKSLGTRCWETLDGQYVIFFCHKRGHLTSLTSHAKEVSQRLARKILCFTIFYNFPLTNQL